LDESIGTFRLLCLILVGSGRLSGRCVAKSLTPLFLLLSERV
jgi:hypothetical protein